MTNYRVPVEFQAPPEKAEPFGDLPTFLDQLFDHLGAFAWVGSGVVITRDLANAGDMTIERINDTEYFVKVTIVDPAQVGEPHSPENPATGEAAAARVVARALLDIGYDSSNSSIDTENITQF